MSARKIVILPESFSGPWSMGLSCPASIYDESGKRLLAVIVTDPNVTLPAEGQVLELGPADTLNQVLARAGLTRVRPVPALAPEPEVIPPPTPGAEPEPVVVVVVPPPEPAPVVPPPEPIIITALPAEPEVILALPKPSLLSRIGRFFSRT